MRGDRLGLVRLAALLEIGAGSNHDPPHLADVARHQRGIGEVTDSDREIDAVLHQIYHSIGQPQFT
jgi:hypothetical protein